MTSGREICPLSRTHPTNTDGASTRCDGCARRLRLGKDGLLPRHSFVPKTTQKLLPRGEAMVDGRRTGQNP